MNKSIRLQKILCVILMYLIIFNPPLFKFNCVIIISILSNIYILMKYKYMKKYINMNHYFLIEIFLLIEMIFLCFISVLNGNKFYIFSYILYWALGDIPFSLCLLYFFKKNKLKFISMINLIIATCVLFSFTAILAFFVPAIKSIFTNMLSSYGVESMDVLSLYRDYGLAANLTNASSFLCAIVASASLYLSFRLSRKYLLFVPVLVFSAVINTRTSIVLIGIGFVLAILLNFPKMRFKDLVVLSLACLIIVGVYFYLIDVLKEKNPDTYLWLKNGIDELFTFSNRNLDDDSYFSYISNIERWKLPDGFFFLFGHGVEIQGGSKYGVYSDIGFVNDFWRGGLMLFIINSAIYIYIVLNIIKRKSLFNKADKLFMLLGIMFLLITLNVKSSFFIHSDVTVVLIIFVIFSFNYSSITNYKVGFDNDYAKQSFNYCSNI